MKKEVSFPIAQLLKDKGFDDDDCKLIYYADFEEGFEPEIIEVSDRMLRDSQVGEFEYIAPTIAEVVMWLYEKHGIWIESRKEITSSKEKVRFSPYIDCFEISRNIRYLKPTEAYEAGIKYCLEKII